MSMVKQSSVMRASIPLEAQDDCYQMALIDSANVLAVLGWECKYTYIAPAAMSTCHHLECGHILIHHNIS
jgi:hypothetical protein